MNTDCSAGHVVEGDVDPVLVSLFSHGCDVLQRSGWRPLTGLQQLPPRYRNISWPDNNKLPDYYADYNEYFSESTFLKIFELFIEYNILFSAEMSIVFL